MAYSLRHHSVDTYELLLDGEPIGSVAQWHSARGKAEGWLAELLQTLDPLPVPFVQDTHEFRTLEDTVRWLDGATVSGESLAP